ncbi:papain family cysteine protease [Nitzschia inconspicua]|uniref:Papain family cysteine protease n=1 Tax=Nitzschia inconspicua TaxID=303405 RepID=A0A9K3KMB4_9STRA|nr:papain family cysteine protease [Nitzschia inconspicua]
MTINLLNAFARGLLWLVFATGSFSVTGIATTSVFPLHSELIDDGHVKGDYTKPLPYSYIRPSDLPETFHWDNVLTKERNGDDKGRSYLTRLLNQHIPQYCGSCWAHAAISTLQDRIKIFRQGAEEINLSIQYILNCGRSAGSCHGGSILKTYQFIKEESGFIPFETCQPYLACSFDSDEGFCPHVDTSCTPFNTCRTCDTFEENGGTCREIDIMPNATVAEYGVYDRDDFEHLEDFIHAVKAEIFARGPIGAVLNGHGLANYTGGIYDDPTQPTNHTHAVSISGWGTDPQSGKEYWIVRNSWGAYWGELGFFRIRMGTNILGIEEKCAWATPGSFTTVNYPCDEDGGNCGPVTKTYLDPSDDVTIVMKRLRLYQVGDL